MSLFALSAAPYSSHAFRSKTPVASYGNGTMRSDTPAIRPGLGRRGSTPGKFRIENGKKSFWIEVGSPGAVMRTADAWPPAPNSSGAEMSKDDWLRTMMNQSDEDDLVTTMCRSKDIHRHIYIYAVKWADLETKGKCRGSIVHKNRESSLHCECFL